MLIAASLVAWLSITARASDLRAEAAFTKDVTAQCHTQACSRITTFDDFENCMATSTSPCHGVLSVTVWGNADSTEFCKADVNSRLFYSFPNVPYVRSVYFKDKPEFAGSAEVHFANKATGICQFWLLGVNETSETASSCGLPPHSTSGVQYTLLANRLQVTIEPTRLYEVVTDRVGFAGMGTSSNCGTEIAAVNYDGVQYKVSVDNRINGVRSSLSSISLWILMVILPHTLSLR